MIPNHLSRQRLAVGALWAAAVFSAGYLGAFTFRPRPDVKIETLGAAEKPIATPVATEIAVHVVGAVNKPGLIRLPLGSRLADAIERCGGALPEADLESPNLAAVLEDGQQIRVERRSQAPERVAAADPSLEEQPKLEEATRPVRPVTKSRGSRIVSLNTATLAQLDSLPGVGPATARKILDYRMAHGGFTSIEELLAVDGIGEKKLAKMRSLVRL